MARERTVKARELIARYEAGERDFRREDLTGSNLEGVNLRKADLPGANFRGANLIEASLIEADLTGANLRKADLRGANLVGADLTGANLAEARLYGANLEGADLTGVNLRKANLTGVNLRKVNLTGVNLRKANLTGANLEDANLEDANLEDANLEDANLTGANLTGANLTGANVQDANVQDANLVGVIGLPMPSEWEQAIGRTHRDAVAFTCSDDAEPEKRLAALRNVVSGGEAAEWALGEIGRLRRALGNIERLRKTAELRSDGVIKSNESEIARLEAAGIPWPLPESILRLAEYGAEKHGALTWQARSRERYVAHAKEHLKRWRSLDESGESNLTHAALDLLLAEGIKSC